MSLLRRFFKTPELDLDTQLQQLDGYSVNALMDLCQSEAPDALREAAIARLPYTQTLRDLALDSSRGNRLQQAARKRLGQLLTQADIDLEQLERDLADPEQLLLIASYCPSASIAVLAKIQAPELLLQQALNGTTTQIRQAAAARIHDRTQLEQLLKGAQGRDKQVYRLARSKLDDFKAEAQRQQALAERAAELCSKLETLARQNADPLFDARLQQLEQDWAALETAAPAGLDKRYQQALRLCQDHQEQKQQALAAERQQAAQAQQAAQTLRSATAALNRLITAVYACTDQEALSAAQIETQLQQLSTQVQAARLISSTSLDERDFDRRCQALRNLLEHTRTQGTLQQLTAQLLNSPADQQPAIAEQLAQQLSAAQNLPDTEQVPALSSAQQTLAQWQQQSQAQLQQARDQQRKIADLCRRGQAAADAGQVRRARGIHRELQEQLHKLPAPEPTLQLKMDAFDAAIERLSDWHEFAVTPKKQALVTAMQALAESTLPPENLAERIHQLQDDWKALSRGVAHADETLWQQFQNAAQVAYEPCKAFFEAQAQAREHNLERRAHLIDQVRTYLQDYSWEQANWKDVEQTLKLARQEWQACWPVPRKAAAEQQQTFDTLMDELHAKLSTEYQTNKERKAALIGQAQRLLELDAQTATEQAKQLQSTWKQTGRTWVRDEQALWKSFRNICDEIFARRKAQQDEQRGERAALEQQARAILDQLAQLLELSGQALLEARSQAAQLRSEFAQLDHLPAASAKRLTARLHDTLQAIADKIERERHADERQRWDTLLEASDQLRAAELALLTGDSGACQAFKQQLDTSTHWPQGARERLEQRLQRAPALTAQQQAEHQQALRLLCIRAEILTGTETPSADKAERMAYQVSLLQQGLGRREDSLPEIILEWVSYGGVETDSYRALMARLTLCRQKA